jgi:hypothetical protein
MTLTRKTCLMVDIQPAKWPEESGSFYDNAPAYFTEPPTIAIIK